MHQPCARQRVGRCRVRGGRVSEPVICADIERDTPAGEGVSPADLKKRERGWMDKKRKLKDPKYVAG